MKLATRFGVMFATLSLAAAAVGPAFADLESEPIEGFMGSAYVDNMTGAQTWNPGPNQIVATMDVYDNTLSPANFGVSSTDLAAQWGDELMTIGTGILDQNVFSIFNSGSSAGPLLTATVSVSFFDFTTSTFLGGYSGNVNFGAGLNPGFYALVTFTGLGALAINLNSTDIVVIQTVTAKTGAANRLGIASLNPPTVGSSPSYMYINASTIGPPGFYTFPNGPANPGYRVGVQVPTPNHVTSWGKVKALYR